jgi:hypothetical protein
MLLLRAVRKLLGGRDFGCESGEQNGKGSFSSGACSLYQLRHVKNGVP